MQHQELIPHLFRTEFRKITTVLCKTFGVEHIEIAEDIVSDTFLLAAETWGKKGIPDQPVAWLYTVSKNKTKNYLKRNQVLQQKVIVEIKKQANADEELKIDLSDENILDSQLQMMFVICHPDLSADTQVAMSLRILCGFGIQEIADAFLTNKETINKRLFRAKTRLRELGLKMEMPGPAELDQRLESVLVTLYLLFNEGYFSVTKDVVLSKDLCWEAMRLNYMLAENKITSKPKVNALLALMCFHASRFDARMNSKGETILYEEQDTSLWNQELIDKGQYYLNEAAKGTQVSRYHLEAAIAYWHTQTDDTKKKWESILQLHNQLLQVEYSPIAALNRTYALAKVKGEAVAINEAEKLKLDNYHLYYALLGNLYQQIDQQKALHHFNQALELAKNEVDRAIIRKHIQKLSD